MSNESAVQQYKLGKYKIDNTKLDNFDKVKLLRMENLLNELVRYYELSQRLMVGFNIGRYDNGEGKV